MDDPVAIALILSGSSAVVALALIGRRLLNERSESASRVADDDVFGSRISPETPRDLGAPAERPVEAPATDDVFTARVASEAPVEAAPVAEAAPPAGSSDADDVFAARISPGADSETAPPPSVATPAEADVFAASFDRGEAAPAVAGSADDGTVPSTAVPGGDVFAGRINPNAPVEQSPAADEGPEPVAPAPAQDLPPVADRPSPSVAANDVFDDRISSGAPTEAAGETAGDAPDPFSQFIGSRRTPEDTESANTIYPEDTCRAFAQGLKDDVLDRALTLFWALAREGSIDSNDLGALLGARSRQAGALVSTPMKRRAEEMDLPLPYVIGRSSPSRLRTWSDQFGIAERMAAALLDEQQARDTMTDDDPERLAGLTAWLSQRAEDEVTATLDEINAFGPGGLPEHAGSQRNWWANRSGGPGHGHAEAWLSAGRLAYPDLKAGVVTFEVLSGLQEADAPDAGPASDEAKLTR